MGTNNYSIEKLTFPGLLLVQTIRSLAYLICLFFPLLTNAQTGLWQTVTNAPISLGAPTTAPQKYLLLKLDAKMMQGLLSNAPLENTIAGQNSNAVIDIPMPDGSIQRFVIVESPIMEPALAQKFPDIKTYSGYNAANPASSIRLDFTPAGFHAMILSPEGTYFIDPFSKATVEYYISYNKKDYISKKNFRCSVGDPVIDSTGTQKKTEFPKLDLPTKIGARLGDGVKRRYRLALAATGEYTAYHGGTVAAGLAAQVTTMSRVNGIFLKDFAIEMILVANNNLLIYTNASTDPYSNSNASALLTQNQNNTDIVIGSANYDIGHVFSTDGGGLAGLGVVCGTGIKARGETGSGDPIGDAYDVDYVAHELGHQFGGNHTQGNSCQRNAATSFEPGSASTIMGYAGICPPDIQPHSDDYFHAGNLEEIHNFITTGSGNTCPTYPTHTNALPVINSYTPSQTIPKGTPILLTGNATDANGNASLTYCWEQMDNEYIVHPPTGSAMAGPVFRSLPPTLNKTRYVPNINDLVNNVNPTWEVLPQVGRTLKFRLVVRDNASGGGSNDHVNIVLTVTANAGPFVVTQPSVTGINWPALSSQTVTWDVANTNLAPVSCATVDILLSTDGGLTYPTTLAANVPNTGSRSITVPNLQTTTARIMVKGYNKAFFDISNNNFTINCVAVTPSTTNASRCGTGTVNLTASGCANGTINWYAGVTGGISIATGTSFTTPSLASSKTYYASCTIGNCVSARVAATATITPLPNAPTPIHANRCGTGTVKLTATGCAGGTINWYTALTGGAFLSAGTTYTTPNLTATTTYYISCTVNNCPSARVSITANILINAIFNGSQTAGTYRASNTIVSTANVASGTNYYAVKSIQLNPGFQAGGQEVFLAKTEPCPQ